MRRGSLKPRDRAAQFASNASGAEFHVEDVVEEHSEAKEEGQPRYRSAGSIAHSGQYCRCTQPPEEACRQSAREKGVRLGPIRSTPTYTTSAGVVGFRRAQCHRSRCLVSADGETVCADAAAASISRPLRSQPAAVAAPRRSTKNTSSPTAASARSSPGSPIRSLSKASFSRTPNASRRRASIAVC